MDLCEQAVSEVNLKLFKLHNEIFVSLHTAYIINWITVSDNGANMTKAITLLQENELKQNASCYEGLSEELEGYDLADKVPEPSDAENKYIPMSRLMTYKLPADVPYRHLSCMAHCLQLVIKPVYNRLGFESIITMAHLCSLHWKVIRVNGKTGRSVADL